jgi:hypothetical protein
VQTILLTCHPTTASAVIDRIEVQVFRPSNPTLELRYTVFGDVDGVLIPAESPPRRADKLWQHTCFEAFVAVGARYYEFNFSPSTEWAIYRFSAYREGMTAAEAAPPRTAVRRDEGCVTVDAAIDLDSLPELRASGGLRLGLSAVIEDTQQRISYWALAHPPGKPDFHHADGFALKLPAHIHPNPPPHAGEGKGGGRNRR